MASKGLTLYALSSEYEALGALLEDSGGDISDPEVERVWDELMVSLDVQRDAKLDGYCKFLKNQDAEIVALEDEVARLKHRVEIRENIKAAAKARLLDFFQSRGIEKVKTPLFSITVCNNGGLEPVGIDGNPTDLPTEFQRVTIDADKDAIRKALQDGQSIPGARLLPRGVHLRVR